MKKQRFFKILALSSLLVMIWVAAAAAADAVSAVSSISIADEDIGTDEAPYTGYSGTAINANVSVSFKTAKKASVKEHLLAITSAIEDEDGEAVEDDDVASVSISVTDATITDGGTVTGALDNDGNIVLTSVNGVGSGSGSSAKGVDGSAELKIAFKATKKGLYKVTLTTTVNSQSVLLYFDVATLPTSAPKIKAGDGANWNGTYGEGWEEGFVTVEDATTSVTVTTDQSVLAQYGISYDIAEDLSSVWFHSRAYSEDQDSVYAGILEATPTAGIALTVTATNNIGSTEKTFTFRTKGDLTPDKADAWVFNEKGYLNYKNVAETGEDPNWEFYDYIATGSDAEEIEAILSLDQTAALPLTWTVAKLPDGLTGAVSEADPHRFVISGKPTKVGTYTYTITVTNTALAKSKTITNTVKVEPLLTDDVLGETEKTEKAATTGKTYSATEKITYLLGLSYDIEVTPAPTNVANLTAKFDASKGTLTMAATDAKKFTQFPESGSFDVKFTVSNDVSPTPVEIHYNIPVTGVAPKLTTKALTTKAGTAFTKTTGLIQATGTFPISFDFEVDEAAFKKALPSSTANTNEARLAELGFAFSEDVDSDGNPTGLNPQFTSKDGTIYITGTPTVTMNKVPVTVKMYRMKDGQPDEDLSEGVTATINLTATGTPPTFKVKAEKVDTFALAAGKTVETWNETDGWIKTNFNPSDEEKTKPLSTLLTVKGSQALSVDVKGLPEGLSFVQNVLETGTTGEYTVGHFSGTAPESGKKYSATVTVTNGTGKKASQKIVLNVQTPVSIKEQTLKKATIGKSWKGSFKTDAGTKPFKWHIATEKELKAGGADTDTQTPETSGYTSGFGTEITNTMSDGNLLYETAESLKEVFGMTMDEAKGVLATDKTGPKEFSTDISFIVVAENGTSDAWRPFTLSIAAGKTKIAQSGKIGTAYRGVSFDEVKLTATGYNPDFYIAATTEGPFQAISSDAKSENNVALVGSFLATGITLATDSNYNNPGVDGDGKSNDVKYKTKGATNTLTFGGKPTGWTLNDSNQVTKKDFVIRAAGPDYNNEEPVKGTYADKKFKITVTDVKPEFNNKTYDLGTLTSNDEVEVVMNLSKGTGDYEWSYKNVKNATLTLNPEDGIANASETMTLKIKTENFKGKKGTVAINVVNTRDSKLKASAKLTFAIGNSANHKTPNFGNPPEAVATTTTGGSSSDGAKPLLDKVIKIEEVTDDEELEEVEAEVKLGAVRGEDSLTEAEKAALEGYVIAAVLPEMKANFDGQPEEGFEVELKEEVKTGAELVWFAFPRDADANEDDEIVDYEDSEGNLTEEVPEDHFVTVTPWLRSGVTYAPVIAVKADEAKAEAKTEE